MKKFLLIICAALLMAGCGNETSDSKTFTFGTVAYGTAMENVGTDPHESYSGWSTLRYGIGETLFKFNERMELEPWLAESFEQVDDYTVRIKIRDGVQFSNAKPLDAQAVKACLYNLISVHDRAPFDLKIAGIEADGQTLTIKSAEKVPSLLNYLSDPYACIVDVTAGVHDGIVVGTGAYKAIKVTDTLIELVPNEIYWNGKPKLKRIIVKGIADGDTLTMAMLNGELDAAQGLPYSSMDLFGDGYKISQADTSRVYQIAFNFNTPALQDIKVRRAISMAVDKEGFCNVLLNGNGTPAVGAFPAMRGVHAEPYDPDGARKLLAQAGWSDSDGDGYVDRDGKNLELNYLTYTSRQELPLLAENVQATLKTIGVKLNVNATDNYKTFLRDGNYDLFAKAVVTAPTGDGEYYFTSHIHPDATDNAGHYHSDAILALGNELHNTFGADKRAALVSRMTQQVLDDCAIIYVAHLRMSLVMKSNVQGFTAHPSDYYEITAALSK